MNANDLARICGATVQDAAKFAKPLSDAASHFGISHSKQRVAMFLAQCAFESRRLTRVEENLSYSGKRLMQVWPRRFPTLEFAQQYAHNPQKLANFVYGGRMGNVTPNSGWHYRGRGLKQLTGHDNYLLATKGLKLILDLDFEVQPDLVATPLGAAWTAAWFWSANNLNAVADSGNYAKVTTIINGGLTGYEDGNDVGMDDRVEYYQFVSRQLEGATA